MSIKDTRQLAIYLDRNGRVVQKTTLSADRREVLTLPQDAVRVITTPRGWDITNQTGKNQSQQAGYQQKIRRRQNKNTRQADFSSRPFEVT